MSKTHHKAIICNEEFFNRSSHRVARDLLGKFLCHRINNTTIIDATITEVEVYDGFNDKASHAWQQKNPQRCRVMFGPAGYWYVYLCYGVHWMLNIVTREKDYPAAILIRGCNLVTGPGRLTKYFKINQHFNEKKAHPESGLWIEDRGLQIVKKEIIQTPRIGIDYAGPIWSQKPWRYTLNHK